ncbi:MAG TPA: GNAT family N-acetyltransferase [Clostridiales bacterium]|nr:GNAT family N-acetyltransferase [Clostridiales bacterium]
MDNYKYRKIFSDMPVIETKRLILKKIELDNANDMYAYASLDQVTRYLLWTPHLNIEETKGYIEYLQKQYRKGNYADWGLNCKSDGVFIGTCGFADMDFTNNKGELGYVLSPSYQGKGYMKEAVEAILRLAFTQLDLNRVELRIMDGNTASMKFAVSMGFKLEGVTRKSLFLRGEYKTLHHYSILNEEFMQRYKDVG